ncbi:hypothetical protein [Streptomyces sp. NPDC059513]|uniref:hypothetical protein n=1 Tax=unclassified Streptomyces TaxID=2593676 RepID=UPI003692A00B
MSVPSVRLNSPPTARWPSSAPAGAAASSSPTARVLLRGEAGAGKTTLLWRLAAHTSARTLDEDLAPLNGLVPLCHTAARPAARGGGFPGPVELSGATGPATPRAST